LKPLQAYCRVLQALHARVGRDAHFRMSIDLIVEPRKRRSMPFPTCLMFYVYRFGADSYCLEARAISASNRDWFFGDKG
jgi:hypothetical protein